MKINREPAEGITRINPVIEPGHTFASVTDKIRPIVLTQRTPQGWYSVSHISFLLMMMLLYTIG